MPQSVHHVGCVTYQGEAVTAFLTEVLGMPTMDTTFVPDDVASHLLGWPAGSGGAPAAMLGAGSRGLLEVISGSDALRDSVPPGAAVIAFIVADLEDRLDQARARGYPTTAIQRFALNDTTTCSAALVTAGDLTFELFRIES